MKESNGWETVVGEALLFLLSLLPGPSSCVCVSAAAAAAAARCCKASCSVVTDSLSYCDAREVFTASRRCSVAAAAHYHTVDMNPWPHVL